MFNKLDDTEFCDKVNELLYSNCKKDICIKTILEEFFEISFFSIKQRYRRCRQRTIFSVHEEILLNNTITMLKEKPCIDVLNDLGFKYESYFYKWFKKHTGMHPSDIKESAVE